MVFVPMMQLFSHSLEGTRTSRDLLTAVHLAQWEMERVKNLGLRTELLKKAGDTVWPPLEEPPLELNGQTWRVFRILKPDSDPLEAAVEVRQDGGTKTTVRFVTLLTDTVWLRLQEQGL